MAARWDFSFKKGKSASVLSEVTLVSCDGARHHAELHPMRRQPIPEVTWNDVGRIVRRDFPASQVADAMAILNEHKKSQSDQESARIQLAVLKLAHGNVERLRMHLMAASTDYRDVLAAAEYPEYFKKGFRVGALPAEEESQIIQGDWKQYKEWLERK